MPMIARGQEVPSVKRFDGLGTFGEPPLSSRLDGLWPVLFQCYSDPGCADWSRCPGALRASVTHRPSCVGPRHLLAAGDEAAEG
jgi:hypothetical protein